MSSFGIGLRGSILNILNILFCLLFSCFIIALFFRHRVLKFIDFSSRLPGEDEHGGRGGVDGLGGGVGLGGGGGLGLVLKFDLYSSRQAGKFVSFSLSVLKFGVVVGGGGGGG